MTVEDLIAKLQLCRQGIEVRATCYQRLEPVGDEIYVTLENGFEVLVIGGS